MIDRGFNTSFILNVILICNGEGGKPIKTKEDSQG